jgi:hypothetical protein
VILPPLEDDDDRERPPDVEAMRATAAKSGFIRISTLLKDELERLRRSEEADQAP